MYMSKVKKKSLKKWVRTTIIVIILVFFAVDGYLLFSSFNNSSKKSKEISYIYRIQEDLDYKVYLYPNSYIEQEYIGKDENYLSDLVKTIDSTFYYQYYSSKGIDLDYTYNVKAIIQGEYKLNTEDSNSKVWSKEYELVKEKGTNKDTYHLTIDPNVKIDYNYYNGEVTNFRKELKLPINATLNIVFNINVRGEIENNSVNDSKSITMSIPLNQQAFKITENLTKDDSKQFTKEKVVIKDIKYNRLMIAIILLSLNLILTVLLFRTIFNIPVKTQYIKKKRKYLKEYGDIIIELANPVQTEERQILDVKNFAEMIDLEEELRIPITFYEYEDQEMGEFIIDHNNNIYRYILREK